MAVNAKPDGYHTVTPYLIVEGAADLIAFLRTAFGARELFRLGAANGMVGHAEVEIGDSRVMISDATPEHRPTPAMLHLYVDNADTAHRQAIEAGATSLQEPSDQFYGDRGGGVKDRFGNIWWVATHIEDVPPDEMDQRARAAGYRSEAGSAS
jgi:PhnB protein